MIDDNWLKQLKFVTAELRHIYTNLVNNGYTPEQASKELSKQISRLEDTIRSNDKC